MSRTPQGAALHWWTNRGAHKSDKRTEEGFLLQQAAQHWGQRVCHVFDRGFAGRPWLTQLFETETRFILHWPSRLKLADIARNLLLLAALAGTRVRVAFLVSLLDPSHDLLRTWLLQHWCHRTGKRSRDTPTPLYRLRSALSRLWLAYPSQPPAWGNSG